jgi:hypothetical protein
MKFKQPIRTYGTVATRIDSSNPVIPHCLRYTVQMDHPHIDYHLSSGGGEAIFLTDKPEEAWGFVDFDAALTKAKELSGYFEHPLRVAYHWRPLPGLRATACLAR